MNTDNPILLQALALRDTIVDDRRRFHKTPELAFEECATAAYVAEVLSGLGLDVRTGIAGTGVKAVLRGDLPGDTLLLRADIDALPISEACEFEFSSQIEGKSHGCGHDAHAAILLGAARILSAKRERLAGTVVFVFQPAEEPSTGAGRMIKEGVLDDPKPDLAAALHVISDYGAGTIALRPGAMTAFADQFEIRVLGKGGHGSNPQDTIDPIVAASQLVAALQTVVSRRLSPLQGAAVSVCQFVAGAAYNIIPDSAYLNGTIRCFDPAVRETILREIRTIAAGVCQSAGASFEWTLTPKVPSVVNDAAVTEEFIRCSRAILSGPDEILRMDSCTTYGEDFSYFAQKVPSVFFFLGIQNPAKGCVYPVHSPHFTVDEDVLPLGAALFANFCLNRSTH